MINKLPELIPLTKDRVIQVYHIEHCPKKVKSGVRALTLSKYIYITKTGDYVINQRRLRKRSK